jgi:hypothetical protein
VIKNRKTAMSFLEENDIALASASKTMKHL